MKKLFGFLFQRERFTTGAAVLSVLTFLSYITGMLRDRLFAHTFGLSRELDLYNASFIIPDLLLNIFVASGISAAFIPVFSGLLAEEKKEEAVELANSVLHGALLVILITGSAAFIAMPWLAPFIGNGFSPAEQQTLISLSRLMLISPLILAVSNTLGAVLVSTKIFWAYGISPITYNLGIIFGALFLSNWFGIFGLVFGTLIGALLHLAPRIIPFFKLALRYRAILNFRDRNFRKVIKLMIPKMFGQPVEQMQFLGFTRIAAGLAAGSVTAVSFARNFQSVPVSLFGIAFSLAAFPALAGFAATNDRENFLKNFRKTLRSILIFTIPSAIGLYLLSDLPIRLFLGGGKFSDEHILRTAVVLSVFALSIPTESIIHLLARSFYALKNTIIPVTMSILGLGLSVGFAAWKSVSLGILAIPYGFFLGSAVEVILLSIILQRFLKKMPASPSAPPSLSSL